MSSHLLLGSTSDSMTTPAEPTRRSGWWTRALIYGAIYLAIGLVFAALAGHAAGPGRQAWRVAAYIISAIAFGTHIQFERVSAGRSIFSAALHAAFSVALGACALAVMANIHAYNAGVLRSRLLRASIILWPLVTAIPAFLVGLAAATLMRPRQGSA